MSTNGLERGPISFFGDALRSSRICNWEISEHFPSANLHLFLKFTSCEQTGVRYSYVKHCYPWKISENTAFREIRCQRANRSIWSDFHDTVTAKVASGITLLIYFFSRIAVFLYPISYGKYISIYILRKTFRMLCLSDINVLFFRRIQGRLCKRRTVGSIRGRYRRWHNILFQLRFFYLFVIGQECNMIGTYF